MAEIPILFSAPMVRAILAGRKSQTRRALKPQPQARGDFHIKGDDGLPTSTWRPEIGWDATKRAFGFRMQCGCCLNQFHKLRWAPGDSLWVRETLTVNGDGLEYAADGEICHNLFDADTNAEAATELWNRRAHIDGPDLHPTAVPSIHMPRWASRITLDVTDVRVERLQAISDADALAEGIYWSEDFEGYCSGRGPDETVDFHGSDPVRSFEKLWDAINGMTSPNGWDANPWVAAITFQRVSIGSAVNG